MISNEMFGSGIIRIKIKGYLKNNTENEIFKFEGKGIKNKDRITYTFEDVKYIIRCKNDSILFVRESNEFVNTFIFSLNKSNCNYLLKENGYDMDLNVNTSLLEINDNFIYIKYVIDDTKCEYEYKIEMSEII